MELRIICLTDYKDNFGSKWGAFPYRSGMDKKMLKNYFNDFGFDVSFIKFNEIDLSQPVSDSDIFLYTSSEDVGCHYKNFIEDIVLGLQEKGIRVIPEYKFLRANNNKVFMENLKKIFLRDINKLNSWTFGVLEEVDFEKIKYPVVFKQSIGSMSRGVSLARNRNELVKIIKHCSNTRNLREDLRDYFRKFKRKGYIKESLYRNKFVLQEFIPGLSFDFKILVFGTRFYIFQRPVRKNDFRASGSGHKNYLYGSKVKYPEGIFDFAEKIFMKLNVPQLSLDIAYNGHEFFLLEFQAVYFGSVGVEKSDGYFSKNNSEWVFNAEKNDVEKVYVESICSYLQ